MDKEYLKQVFTYIVVSLVAIGLMIYVGYHMVSSFTAGVETQPAYIDTFNETFKADAYILRREEVLYSNTSGVVNYLIRDGGKAAVGDEVADVYRSGGDGVRERIDEIDRKIEALEKVEANTKYLSVSDAVKIDAEISELLISARKEIEDNSFSSAVSTSESILSEMNRRLIVTGEVEDFADEIERLKLERKLAISELTNVAETIKSEYSAYYFYDVDGYESAFAFDDIDSLSLADINAMTESQPETLTGREAGKIVFDYIWYIAVPTDYDSASFFTVGKNYDVNFGLNGEELSMQLYSVLKEEDKEAGACLIFSSSVMPSGFEYTRMQPVTVTVRTYEGYRVPLSAVRMVEYDGVTVEGVYILYGNTVYFRRIDIILSQDGYVLCSSGGDDDDGSEENEYYDFPLIGADTSSAETEPPPKTETETETETETAVTVPSYEEIPYLNLYDMVITSSKNIYDGKIVKTD